jgi:hypothetical protein
MLSAAPNNMSGRNGGCLNLPSGLLTLIGLSLPQLFPRVHGMEFRISSDDSLSRIVTVLVWKPADLILDRTGVLCIILCIALGIANIFSFAVLRIIFSVLCL